MTELNVFAKEPTARHRRRRGKPLTEQDHQDIIRRLLNGENTRPIGAAYGRSDAWVSLLAAKLGLEYVRRPVLPGTNRPRGYWRFKDGEAPTAATSTPPADPATPSVSVEDSKNVNGVNVPLSEDDLTDIRQRLLRAHETGELRETIAQDYGRTANWVSSLAARRLGVRWRNARPGEPRGRYEDAASDTTTSTAAPAEDAPTDSSEDNATPWDNDPDGYEALLSGSRDRERETPAVTVVFPTAESAQAATGEAMGNSDGVPDLSFLPQETADEFLAEWHEVTDLLRQASEAIDNERAAVAAANAEVERLRQEHNAEVERLKARLDAVVNERDEARRFLWDYRKREMGSKLNASVEVIRTEKAGLISRLTNR